MRTTIDIEDDVLGVVKDLARSQHVSAGDVASRLIREALTGRQLHALPHGATTTVGTVGTVGGFRPFPARGKVVTNEEVNVLRDEEGI